MTTPQNARPEKPICTSACLIIGDELLNGKTVDTNSNYFARFCFDLGVEMKRVEVIADDEGEIMEAVRRMNKDYDFVVTSGGIGPTHDDITYSSIAKAFNLPLTLHNETWARMRRLSKSSKTNPPFDWETPSPMLSAKQRMALLPTGPNVRNVYISPDLWVPICIVDNVHILPGIPRIFEQLLEGLRPLLKFNVDNHNKQTRVLISTPMKESEIAGFLTELQEKVKERRIKVGSYPRWGKKRNTVTLTGPDKEYIEGLVDEVEKGVGGLRVSVEDDEQGEPEETEEVGTTPRDEVKT